MIKLPKVTKAVGTGLTKIEKVRNLVLAATLAAGLTVAGGPGSGAEGATPQKPAFEQTTLKQSQGALLLAPATNVGLDQIAQHYSHWSHSSHYSHSSHSSHYSHYSSR